MSKGSGPSPDFMGLADRMGNWNMGANQAQTLANRPNQYTPWGSTTWSQAPGGWNGMSGTGGGNHPPGPGPGQPGGPGSPGGPTGGGGATGGGGGSGGGPATGGGGAGGGGHVPIAPPGGFSSGAPWNGIDLPNGPNGNPRFTGNGGLGEAGYPDMGGSGGPQTNLTQGPNGPPPPGGGPSWTPPPGWSSGDPAPPPGGWGSAAGLNGGSGITPPNGPGGGAGGGSSTEPWDPAIPGMPGQWSQTTTLNPELQAAADAQMKLQNRRSGFGLDQFSNLSNAMKNPFPLGGLPSGGSALDPNALSALDTGMGGRNRAEDALYGRSTSRLDPQWGQQEDQLRTRLANQGLDPTSEAFQKEMGNFGRSKNDAYSQAMQNAIAGGGQEQALQFGMGLQGNQQRLGAQAQGYGQAEQSRGRTLSELLQQRELPINEMNALMNGQNVQNPQFGPFMGAGAAQSPNYLGAGQAQGQYGLQSAAMNNGMWGDIGQGAGTFAKFLPFLFGA